MAQQDFDEQTGDARPPGASAATAAAASQRAQLLRRAVELLQLSAGGGQLPEFSSSLGSDLPASSLSETAGAFRADEPFVPLGAAADAPPMTREQFASAQEQMIEQFIARIGGPLQSSIAPAVRGGAMVPRDDYPHARTPFGLMLPRPIWAPIMSPSSATELQSIAPGPVGIPTYPQPASTQNLFLPNSTGIAGSPVLNHAVMQFGDERSGRVELLRHSTRGAATSASPGMLVRDHAAYGIANANSPSTRAPQQPAAKGAASARARTRSMTVAVELTKISALTSAIAAQVSHRVLPEVTDRVRSEISGANALLSAQRRAIVG